MIYLWVLRIFFETVRSSIEWDRLEKLRISSKSSSLSRSLSFLLTVSFFLWAFAWACQPFALACDPFASACHFLFFVVHQTPRNNSLLWLHDRDHVNHWITPQNFHSNFFGRPNPSSILSKLSNKHIQELCIGALHWPVAVHGDGSAERIFWLRALIFFRPTLAGNLFILPKFNIIVFFCSALKSMILSFFFCK